MIIYSIIPVEIIFQNTSTELYQRPIFMNYKGELVEVVAVKEMSYKITRVLSTSPKAYLNPELQPGRIIKV